MNQQGRPTYKIITPNEINDLARTQNVSLSQNLNSIKLNMEIKSQDIYATLEIPEIKESSTVELIRAIPYPVFQFGQRYQVQTQIKTLIYHRPNLAKFIKPLMCKIEEKICYIDEPIFKIHNDSPCAFKQIEHKNFPCRIKKSTTTEDFFH